MGYPSLCPRWRNPIPQESCFLGVREGLSVPLCLGLSFPRAVESGEAQRTARAQRALVPVVPRPHHWAEGTHARQHCIWFLRESPRVYGELWGRKDVPSWGDRPCRDWDKLWCRTRGGGHPTGEQGPCLPSQGRSARPAHRVACGQGSLLREPPGCDQRPSSTKSTRPRRTAHLPTTSGRTHAPWPQDQLLGSRTRRFPPHHAGPQAARPPHGPRPACSGLPA